MPNPDIGNTAGIGGGGGAAHGLPAIIQMNECVRAGIRFRYLAGISVSAWNVLNIPCAYKIWNEDIHSEADVWDFNPEAKAILRSVLKNIPHELFRHPVKFLKFVSRALANVPTISLDTDLSSANLSPLTPFVDKVVALTKMYGLNEVEGGLTLSPLVKKLRGRVDLSEFWKQETKVHIFVRSVENGDVYIFSNKQEDCDKNSHFVYMDSEETVFKVAEAACALRSIFPSVLINGHYYCDAGPAIPFPVEHALDEGCDTILAFMKDFDRYRRGRDMLDCKLEDDDVCMRYRYNDIKRWVDIRRRQEKQKLHVIHPQYPLHADLWLLGLSPAAKKHTLEIETRETRKWIKEDLNIEPATD